MSRVNSGPMNPIRPIPMIVTGPVARTQANGFATVHHRSRQVAGSVASHMSRTVKVSLPAGGGAYRSATGTPHQSAASCLVSRASRRMPSSAAGSANRPRPSPAPTARRPSSMR
jgi:hypothetical protein